MKSSGVCPFATRLVTALACVAAAGLPALAGESNWLTISGSGTTAGETVEIAPELVSLSSDLRLITVRVNRLDERMGYDGEPYRSYQAEVRVDCVSRKAAFSRITFYQAHQWTGPSREASFAGDGMPPLRFADMQPNPKQRIIEAACSLGKVKSTAPATP